MTQVSDNSSDDYTSTTYGDLGECIIANYKSLIDYVFIINS